MNVEASTKNLQRVLYHQNEGAIKEFHKLHEYIIKLETKVENLIEAGVSNEVVNTMLESLNNYSIIKADGNKYGLPLYGEHLKALRLIAKESITKSYCLQFDKRLSIEDKKKLLKLVDLYISEDRTIYHGFNNEAFADNNNEFDLDTLEGFLKYFKHHSKREERKSLQKTLKRFTTTKNQAQQSIVPLGTLYDIQKYLTTMENYLKGSADTEKDEIQQKENYELYEEAIRLKKALKSIT